MGEGKQSTADELARLRQERERLEQAVAELSILNEISTAINSTLSLERILDLIVQKCLKHFGVEQAAVMLLEQEPGKPFQTVIRRDASQPHLPFRLNDQLAGWMLLHRTALLSNDFAADERFRGAAGGGAALPIRSLLLVPLQLKGQMTGLVALFNRKGAAGFAAGDQRLLSIIATQSAQVIENVRLHEEEQKLARIREELGMARDIQARLLPEAMPKLPGYDICGRSVPAKEIGGDYFDFIALPGDRLAFCIGDVSGKGLPAALLMANLQAAVRGQTPRGRGCAENLRQVNALLFHNTAPEKFASLFYGILDGQAHRLCFGNAGHNPPLLASADGRVRRLGDGGLLLGCLEESCFDEETVALEPGDLLLAFSDGISEALDEEDREFGEPRLDEWLRAAAGRAAAAGAEPMAAGLVDGILAEVRRHAGRAPQYDDMTLVVIRRCR